MNEYACVEPSVKLGKDVKLSKFINLYGCEIGDETKIGAFVEIQKNARVGRCCKISSHSFICEGVDIEDDVFIGHSVTFINDTYPRATVAGGGLQTEADWKVEKTRICRGASIGSGSTILKQHYRWRKCDCRSRQCGDQGCAANAIVAGNPAKFLRFVNEGEKVEHGGSDKNSVS